MEKDNRYRIVKPLMSDGQIKSFKDIFLYIPKSVVARDLGINNVRFTRLMNDVGDFTLNDIFRLAAFCEIDELDLLKLVDRQYQESKKSKIKK
jgi:hypothetical protein